MKVCKIVSMTVPPPGKVTDKRRPRPLHERFQGSDADATIYGYLDIKNSGIFMKNVNWLAIMQHHVFDLSQTNWAEIVIRNESEHRK